MLRKYGLLLTLGLTLSACQGSQNSSSANDIPNVMKVVELADTKWQLVELVSTDGLTPNASPVDQNAYQLHLNRDGTANIKLNCNRANGPWSSVNTAEGTSGIFNIGPAAMTRAMCPPDSLDQRIARELKYIRSYVMKDGHLNLLLLNGGSQIWAPLEGPAT